MAIAVLALSGVAADAAACSLVTPVRTGFVASREAAQAEPSVMPTVEVRGIKRGNALNPSDSCSDLGAVTFAIRANRATRSLLYSFETIHADGGAHRDFHWP